VSAVLFNDTADTGLVNLTTTLSPYSLTVSNNSLNYTLSGAGSLSGPGGLTKNGSAQLTLETANSFSGPVTVNAGTVLASAVNALGSGGALTVNNATVNIGDYNQSAGAVALTNGNILGMNGALTASGYTLASGTVSAHLVNGNLTKTGSGTVSLTASNNIGVTTIDGGVLRVTDPNALGLGGFDGAKLTAINSGGALLFDGTITTDEHLWLAGAGPDGLGALRVTNGLVIIAQHS
jgi:autotransporter-associated beta strand protein